MLFLIQYFLYLGLFLFVLSTFLVEFFLLWDIIINIWHRQCGGWNMGQSWLSMIFYFLNFLDDAYYWLLLLFHILGWGFNSHFFQRLLLLHTFDISILAVCCRLWYCLIFISSHCGWCHGRGMVDHFGWCMECSEPMDGAVMLKNQIFY